LVRKEILASCCVIVLPPSRTPPAPTLRHAARAMPRRLMPKWPWKRLSSMAMKAAGTCLGSSEIFTGSRMSAPRRAIGSPSTETRVRLGAAIGCRDFESGAVIASQATSSMKIARMARMIRFHPQPRGSNQRRRGSPGGGRSDWPGAPE
jgi:hypothetical protein